MNNDDTPTPQEILQDRRAKLTPDSKCHQFMKLPQRDQIEFLFWCVIELTGNLEEVEGLLQEFLLDNAEEAES